MLPKEIGFGTLVIVTLVLFHVACLYIVIELLIWLQADSDFWLSNLGSVYLLAIAVLTVIFVHTVEAWVWALIYLKLGEFDNLNDAIYFSVVTVTALGYGDITLSKKWQLLSSFEAMGGLLLFGASTAFLINLMGKVIS